MHIYIYIYISVMCLSVCLSSLVGGYKRGLEYGVTAPAFYGDLREQTGENPAICRCDVSVFMYLL